MTIITNKQFINHYSKTREIAVSKVEAMARNILKQHPCLDEFVMAMGLYCFTYKDKSKSHLETISSKMNSNWEYVYFDTFSYLKPLNKFIGEWDSIFKITGEGVRFTATGKRITDW